MDNGVFAALIALFFCASVLFVYVMLHFKFTISLMTSALISAVLYFFARENLYYFVILGAASLFIFLFFEPMLRTIVKESANRPGRFYAILTHLSLGGTHWPALSATLVIDIFHKHDFVAAREKIAKIRKSILYNKLVKNFFCNIILARIELEQSNYKEAERYLEAAQRDFYPSVKSPAVESLLKAVRMYKPETGT